MTTYLRTSNIILLCIIPFIRCYTQTEKPEQKDTISDPIYEIVEEMPSFPGGNQELFDFIKEKTEIIIPWHIAGGGSLNFVIVKFVVEKDGTITQEEVVKGIDPALDREALRLVREMPRWRPGKQRGETVRVHYTIPMKPYRIE